MAISMMIIIALVALFIIVPAFVVIAGIVVAVIIASTRKKFSKIHHKIKKHPPVSRGMFG